jgi:hypothetical protein
MNSSDYEKLGALYLGRPVAEPPSVLPLLLPSKHLVTHGVIVGMTGSGKTGLGAVLLEECAIDGIPAIVIDPKGDLGNLLLTFPKLDAASFAPWAPPGEDPQALAERHTKGLAEWGQDGARIARFENAVERVLYTPGSSLGRPLALLPSLGAPPAGTDVEVLRERALATTSGLLSLVGVDADPVQSPEHSLVATILLEAWTNGRGLDITGLLRAIQQPPFANLGVMDVESVVPSKSRAALAVKLNNAFASPAMAGFLQGDPLDAGRLLFTPEGKPKLSILSLAHLSDADRMFFVTVLLGEVLAWMRAQSGTTSLRAVLYMDEVFGFFPPVANPPSKTPMLTLLKQARAFGLGVVLATQNPVDLDYKGLSNTGTWMLGRLQTERDKLRVLDGLEGAASGHGFNRAEMDSLLSGLTQRRFLLHSVHEPEPQLLQTRWALSYLRGPLSREEMRKLATPAETRTPQPATAIRNSLTPPAPTTASPNANTRPVLPPEVKEFFFVRSDLPRVTQYRPGLLCKASLHYVDAKAGLDTWMTPNLLAPLGEDGPEWDKAWFLGTSDVELLTTPNAEASFSTLPAAASKPASYKAWEKQTVTHLQRDRPLVLLTVPEVSLTSTVGEARDAFAARLAQHMRELRDAEVEKLQAKWQPKILKAKDKVLKAERKLDDAKSASSTQVLTSGIEIGASVLGAMFGSGRRSAATAASRAARSARTVTRSSSSKESAQADLDQAKEELQRLQTDVNAALEEIKKSWHPEHAEIVEKPVAAKKADLKIERFVLTWVPV